MIEFRYIEIINKKDKLVIKRISLGDRTKSGITRLTNIVSDKTNLKRFKVKVSKYDKQMPIKDNPNNTEEND